MISKNPYSSRRYLGCGFDVLLEMIEKGLPSDHQFGRKGWESDDEVVVWRHLDCHYSVTRTGPHFPRYRPLPRTGQSVAGVDMLYHTGLYSLDSSFKPLGSRYCLTVIIGI
jgi:hypothetical protein